MTSHFKVYGALVVQTTIGALTYFAAKRALAELPAAPLAMLRFGGATLCFIPLLLLLTRKRLPPPHAWGRVALLGLLGVPLNQGFFLTGLQTTTPAHASLMYAMTPLFVFLLAVPLGVERVDRAKLIGLALGLAGAAVVILDSDGGIRGGSIGGDLKILGACGAWAAYSVLGKPLVAEFGAVAATSWALSFGTVFFLPFGVPPLLHLQFASLSWATWGSLAYLIIMTSVISYLCWYYAVGKLDPSRAAVFGNMQPVLTAIIGALYFHNPLTVALGIGGALVVGGVAVTTMRPPP